MWKKKNCGVTCILLLLLLIGCPDVSNHEENKSNSKKSEEPKKDSKNLGSVLFMGNSHTYKITGNDTSLTSTLEKMAQENGYTLKAYHIPTGGNIPLGNDFASRSSMMISNDVKRYEKLDHLSHFMSQNSATLFPEKLSWIIAHDGSVYNSLTSAGAFMGLAAAFGTKTACYQSWDLPEMSLYAAAKFQLPMIPVGYAIPTEYANYKYHAADGHMVDEGAYVFSVAFLHFLTKLPVDQIVGNGGLTKLTDDQKTAAKQLVKNAYTKSESELAGIGNYYDCISDFSKFTIEKSCQAMEAEKEYKVNLNLSQPAIFQLPASTSGKKIKVTVTSRTSGIIGDVWFYDAKGKQFTAQGYNNGYTAEYVYNGSGAAWESDGSQVLIVTRRGKTTQMGIYDVKKRTFEEGKDALFAEIEEAVDVMADFSITTTFLP